MSFRKKTKPVISVSAVARSRQSKAAVKSESATSNDVKQNSLSDAPKLSTQCPDGPKEDDKKDTDIVDSCEGKIPRKDVFGDLLTNEKPRKNADEVSRGHTRNRFKRARPPCGVVRDNTESKQRRVDGVEEESFCETLRDAQLMQGKKGENVDDAETRGDCAVNRKEKEDFSCRQLADKPGDHIFVLEILPNSSNEPDSDCKDSNAGDQDSCIDNDAENSSSVLESEVNERQTGFVVTESRISEVKTVPAKSHDEPNKSASSQKSETSSTLTAGTRYKRKRIAVNLSRADKRSTLKVKDDSTDSQFKKPDSSNVLEDSSNQTTCSDKNGSLRNSVEFVPNAQAERTDTHSQSYGDSLQVGDENFAKNHSKNQDLVLDSNETCSKNAEETASTNGQEKITKRSKRVRFKPNVVAKSSRSTSKNTEKNEKTEKCDSEAPAAYQSHDAEVKKSETDQPVSKKKVHFSENAVKEGMNDEVRNSTAGNDNSFDGRSAEDVDMQGRSLPQSGQYSDADDGSQSESESLHHHNRRKFAPCLGPQVRQRKRLSSMTLSEDEGHVSDKNNQDSGMSITSKDAANELEQNEKNADQSVAKKKQKRKRIVMKEPKEKMTMFDYIYYNPKSDEDKQNEQTDEKRQSSKNIQERLSDNNGSEIVLGSIDGDETNSVMTASGLQDGDAENEEDFDEDEVIAPQIKIGADGQAVIDEASLLLRTTRSKMSLESSEIVFTDNFDPYQRKQGRRKKKRWAIEDTLEFYRVLSRIGTDFSFMVKFFPDCTRTVLKKKFKTEEKFNGDLIDRALKNMLPMDQALIEELRTATSENSAISSRKQGDSAATDENNGSIYSRKRKDATGRGKNRKLLTNDRKSGLNNVSRDEAIVEEEILTMEVAENVTI